MRWALPVALLLGLAACEPAAQPCPECVAIRGATVLDGLGAAPLAGQTVLIRDGRIAALGADVAIPPEARVLDGEGRWVIPGLIDAHAHVTILPLEASGALATRMDREASEQALRTMLAFGITSARNPAAPAEDGVALREAVARGEILGPTLVTAGEALNPRAFAFGPSVGTPDVEAARAEVRRQATLGVDLIKVYAAMPPDLIAAASGEAHALGLETIGHLQRATWQEGVEAGLDHITHGAPWSAAYLPEPLREGYRGDFRARMDWLEAVEPHGEAWQATVRALAASGVSVDPTLVAIRTKLVGDDPAYRDSARLAFAPGPVRSLWRQTTFTDDWTAADDARGRAVWPRMLALTRSLHTGGVRLLAGTDSPNPWVVPGLSLHEELQLLASAGIPPLDVLRIATSNGADALGLGETGRIAVGMEADLVILSADPLADLAHTRDIEWVIVDGQPFRPDSLLEP